MALEIYDEDEKRTYVYPEDELKPYLDAVDYLFKKVDTTDKAELISCLDNMSSEAANYISILVKLELSYQKNNCKDCDKLCECGDDLVAVAEVLQEKAKLEANDERLEDYYDTSVLTGHTCPVFRDKYKALFDGYFNLCKAIDDIKRKIDWYAPHRTRIAIWLNQAKVVKLYYFIARVSIWAPWCDVARPARLPALYPCGLRYLW